MTERKQLSSFDLNESMMQTIGQEFDIQKVTDKFARAIAGKRGNAIEEAARAVFREYGVGLMKRSLQLGEEYMDRTYETLKRAIDKTGTMYFPLVPQRYVEIAYLSTQPIKTMSIVQNNGDKLTFKIPQCGIFANVKEKCGQDIANSLPCMYACMATLETLFNDLNIKVSIGTEAKMPTNGYCQFAAKKL